MGAQVGPAHATPPGSRALDEPDSIEALVREYRSGDRERAVAVAGLWSAERIVEELHRLIPAVASRKKASRPEVKVLPSLDVIGAEGDPAREKAEEREATRLAAAAIVAERALSRLGHWESQRLAPGLRTAAGLFEVEPLGPRGAAFARTFYLLAGLTLHWHVEIAEAERLLTRGLLHFPDDPELHTALGSTIETVVSLRTYAPSPASRSAMRNTGGYQSETGEHGGSLRGATLALAGTHYGRALRVDPTLDEARLRRARVHLLEDRPEEALRDLERVAAEARQPRQRYLAWLFAGRARERLGDLTGAVAAYRACVANGSPTQRVSLLALGRALDRMGEKAEAQELFSAASARDVARVPADPWWSYVAGQPERFDDLVTRLREAVRPVRGSR